jgi:hypothetical protein
MAAPASKTIKDLNGTWVLVSSEKSRDMTFVAPVYPTPLEYSLTVSLLTRIKPYLIQPTQAWPFRELVS